MKIFIFFALNLLIIGNAHSLDKISIQFHWLEQFEFAGFYIAKERGFYEDEGLDVSFLPHKAGETNVVESVLSDRAHYGVNYSSIIQNYHNGQPIVAIAALLQESPLAIMTLKNGEIKSPADLKNKKIMIGGDALSSVPIMALLFSHGLLHDDIIKQTHSHDLNDLILGNTDAITTFVSNEPFKMKELGIEFQLFDPAESQLSFYENLLFTTQDEINNNPERVKSFLRATIKGWHYAFNNIEKTAEIIYSKYNEQNKSYESLVFEGLTLKKLAYKESIPFGSLDLRKLEKIEDAYHLMGIELSEKPIIDFVWDRSKPKEKFNLTAQEKAFISNTIINVGTTTQWAPFSFVHEETDEPAGIGNEIWQKIVKAANLKSTITHFDNFEKELASLRNKEIDLIYSAGITEDREEYALFTEPYAQFPISIATSKDEHFIQSIDQLRGKKIAIGRNFTAHKMMMESYPFLDYVPVPNALDGLQMVSKDQVYAFVDIMPSLVHSISQNGFTNLKISGNTGLNFQLRIMIRDDYPELVSISNKIISTISMDEKQNILNRWINVQYDQSFNPYQYWPQAIAFFIIFTLIFLWMHRSKQIAMSANQAKSEFLASMSHEIRTPMTGVIGFADLLLEDDLPEESKDKVLRIKDSTNSLLHLLNDILDMSKLEAGKMEIEHIDFNLKKLISDVSGQIEKTLTNDKPIEISVIYPDDLPIIVNSDPKRIRQLLVNIVGNSIKFTPEGAITITASFEKDKHNWMIKISVNDTGIGMSDEVIKKVFSKFTQADASVSRKYEGSGLGLAICSRLVDLLGGEIGVKSKEKQGSLFWFTFPYIEATTDLSDETEIKTKYIQTLRPLKILLAEDNRVNQLILKKILTSAGHQLTIVENGLEAIANHEENDYDLILMDIRMPEMNGHDAVKIIRQKSHEKSNIPIIAVTADVMKDSVDAYMSEGFNGYAHKPIDKHELFQTINNVMSEDIHALET